MQKMYFHEIVLIKTIIETVLNSKMKLSSWPLNQFSQVLKGLDLVIKIHSQPSISNINYLYKKKNLMTLFIILV
jgi:hypothetical protein